MEKTLMQGVLGVSLFFALWFGLSQINWLSIFKIEQARDATEQKLGNLLWEHIQSTEKEVVQTDIQAVVDSLVDKLCTDNAIHREQIKVHIVSNTDINAFALPDGHLVVYTGLLQAAMTPEELCGVLGHELAHVEHNHVMKKLLKEMGLSVLVSMTTGNRNSTMIQQTVGMLSSSAYDRQLEEDADRTAVEYLAKAHIKADALADFLYRYALNESQTSRYLSWLQSHPDTKQRALEIVNYSQKKKNESKPVLQDATWKKLKETLAEYQTESEQP